jgi:MFS family permease
MQRQGGLWHDAEFSKLWGGHAVSELGSQVTVLALPLLAVLVLGAGAAEMGGLVAARLAARLAANLVVGGWIDRLPRRRILIASDLASALVIGSVPAAALAGWLRLEQLYAVTALAGVLESCRTLATASFLPTLVGRGRLVEANSRVRAATSVAQVGGPALGGALVQAVTAPIALLADAVSFLASAALTATIRRREAPAPRPTVTPGVWADLTAGMRWLRANAVLSPLLTCVALANLAWFGQQALLVLYATRELSLPPALLGIVLAAAGPAGLASAVLVGRITTRLGLGPTLVASLAIETVSRVMIPLAGGPSESAAPELAALVLLLSQALFGFSAPLWDVNALSLRQAMTPDRLLGRVNAAASVVAFGTAPVGSLLAGWLGETIGVRSALLAMALFTLLATLRAYHSPVRSMREPPTARQVHAPV